MANRLHKKSGEVCAYVGKELEATVLKELSYTSGRNLHQLWLNVQYKKLKSMMICIMYRPDDSPLSSFEEGQVLKPNYSQAFLLIKAIRLNFRRPELRLPQENSSELEKFYTQMNVTQLIEKPTRIKENTESLLDVILVSPNTRVHRSGVYMGPL